MLIFRRAFCLALLCVAGASPAMAQSEDPGSNPFELSGSGPARGALETDAGRKMSFEDLGARNGSRNAPPDVMIQVENSHAAQQFEPVLALLAPYPNSPNANRWLDQKARSGSILYMWALSDRLAAVDPGQSVFWAYAALIGTWQEAAICVDSTPELAAETLSKRYPHSLAARRSHPWVMKESISKAFALHKSLQERSLYPDPIQWLCKPYGSPKRSSRAPVSYDPLYWDMLRVQSRNRTRSKLGLPASQREKVPVVNAKARR